MTPYYSQSGIEIYHGDCREVLPEIADSSVRMIWTDPPYGNSNQDGDLQSARVGVKGGRQKEAVPIQGDSEEEWRGLMPEFLQEAARVLIDDSCCCCCCTGGGGPSPKFADMAQWMDDYLEFFHAVVWDKSGRGNGLGWRFRRNYEFVMVAHKKGGKIAWSDEDRAVPNVLRVMPEPSVFHPTPKPMALINRFVEWHTTSGDLILDPFMGSGPVMVSAKKKGRRAIGIEIEEKYCEIAAKRLSQEVLTFD